MTRVTIQIHMKHRAEKHERQLNREPKNMSKSVRLDLKKHCNRAIKKLEKNQKCSLKFKAEATAMYNDIKNKFKTK